MSDPTADLMAKYLPPDPARVEEFNALARRILAERYAGVVAHLEDAIDAAADERPDLFMAYVAGKKI